MDHMNNGNNTMSYARIQFERKKLHETLVRNKGAGKHVAKKGRVNRKDERKLKEE